MFNTPFEVKVKNDANRVIQALNMRKELGYHPRKFEKDLANCFEIFIILAQNMDDILHDLKHGNRTEEWFWLMMKNMGLIFHDNDDFVESDVDTILDMFVHRKYYKNGDGGPFPLKRPLDNMRRVELWYQVNWYVNENFEYEFNEIESEDFENE